MQKLFIVLIVSFLSSASAQSFSCRTQELQFSGSIKNLNDIQLQDGSVHCAYQLHFAVANQHILCPIDFQEATQAILVKDGSCAQNRLELGSYKSGVLVKQAGRFIID